MHTQNKKKKEGKKNRQRINNKGKKERKKGKNI